VLLNYSNIKLKSQMVFKVSILGQRGS